MKKVLVFTGSRANYSSTRAIMKAIMQHPKLELQTVVGGSALLDRYGNVTELMQQDGIPVNSKFHMIIEGETPSTMAKSTGVGIIDLSMIFENLNPDIVLVVGDRFDVMAPVITAAYMNIVVAHTMGGEVSGTIDESIRHAITKFSHIHFPANNDAKHRIIKMGENPEMVFNVGCPRMDLVNEKLLSFHRTEFNYKDFFTKNKGIGGIFNISKKSFLLVSYHPVTTEYGSNLDAVKEVLYALSELKMPTIMLWPNSDAGSNEISKGIRTFREKNKTEWLHMFTNLPFDTYLRLMTMTDCLIGNSSSGIREGAFLGTPVVNIGSRQNRRLKGKNVIDVQPNKKDIINSIAKQLKHKKYESENIYGSGTAGLQIAEILSNADVDDVQKIIEY
jgi:UDP-hydrolysing UDP-N-acetyl-D-glucosamine 2-epimerase